MIGHRTTAGVPEKRRCRKRSVLQCKEQIKSIFDGYYRIFAIPRCERFHHDPPLDRLAEPV